VTAAPRPLLVVALGGNAISAPTGPLTLAVERGRVDAVAVELARLAAGGWRLLVVHGNGPQVGRLLDAGHDLGDLDVLVAQTQGELGYLLADSLERAGGEPVWALVTRTRVDGADPAFAAPDKPIGPVLRDRPPVAAAPYAGGEGWRRVVASPLPLEVPEHGAVARLLEHGHVIAGGGGGVPVTDAGPAAAVVDKDRVAAWLARRLGAAPLLFATDVDGVYDDFGGASPRLRRALSVAEARERLRRGDYPAGSMAPKVESAVAFATGCGRPAFIASTAAMAAALGGDCGTRVG
jgi:carbamate kinase